MKTTRRLTRAASLVAVVTAACSGLHAATPNGEHGAAREALHAVLNEGPNAQADAAETLLQPVDHDFGPWSLVAGGLGVMVFVVRRRRRD